MIFPSKMIMPHQKTVEKVKKSFRKHQKIIKIGEIGGLFFNQSLIIPRILSRNAITNPMIDKVTTIGKIAITIFRMLGNIVTIPSRRVVIFVQLIVSAEAAETSMSALMLIRPSRTRAAMTFSFRERFSFTSSSLL